MSKKMVKVLTSLFTALMMITMVAMPVMAEGVSVPTINGNVPGADKVNNLGGTILGIAATIGMVVAVLMLVWLGIKYLSAAPNEKADIKKGMTIYVVGALLLFAASGIVTVLQNIGAGVSNTLK